MKIESITIEKLNGENNYAIKIEDNSFILVGENGTGKSTVLSMIYYLLKLDWKKLIEYDYEKITIVIDGDTCCFPRSDLISINSSKNSRRGKSRLLQELKAYTHSFLNKESSSGDITIKNISNIIEKIRKGFETLGNPPPPRSLVTEYINEFNADNHNEFQPDIEESYSQTIESMRLISEKVQCSLLYLPTYRRIEQDLEMIFPESTRLTSYIEENVEADGIVQFGMKDVEGLLNNAMQKLSSDFRNKLRELIASSLQDILGNRYENYAPDVSLSTVSEKEFEEILARVDSETLSSQVKEEIRKNTKNYGRVKGEDKPDKVILYFINKLLELHTLQSANEKNLISFIGVCNNYLVNKELFFDRVKFEISIVLKRVKNTDGTRKTVKWETLSSGEKQIISLFSKLYLGDGKDFILIIDEPELSLSLEWQSTFLEDVKNTGLCEGIFAVTHSPFIYKNSLKKYAKGIDSLMEIL